MRNSQLIYVLLVVYENMQTDDTFVVRVHGFVVFLQKRSRSVSPAEESAAPENKKSTKTPKIEKTPAEEKVVSYLFSLS